MAGRSSSGIGVGIAVTVLSLSTLTLFVFTTVFFSKYKDRDRRVVQLEADATEVVTAAERNRDDIRAYSQAARDSRKSLVGFLSDNQGDVMEKVTGVRRDTAAELAKKIEGVPGIETGTLVSSVQTLVNENKSLKTQLAQAESARQTALTDLSNESARVSSIMESHQQTVDALNKDIDAYKAEHAAYVSKNEDYKKRVDSQLSTALNEFAEREKRLSDQITSLTESNLILQSQLDALRGTRSATAFKGDDEAALVDGMIIGTSVGEKTVYINRGRKHHVVLGMSFSVYADKAAIRPDAEGNYPAGKATIEVISVNDMNSTARITGETRGNPIVDGDVIANAIYDPSKVYKFAVIGNFDVNRDGVSTPGERSDMASLIESWGGKVTDELSGDVDFVVLGDRPINPPQPTADAPLEVVLNFEQQKKLGDRYDAIYKQANQTSVPTLSENRLYTLIGRSPSALPR
jgi:hypothetical protein